MSEKKTRALPHVWKTFSSLSVSDAFYLGKEKYTKTSCLTARPFPGGVTYGPFVFVTPWRRVKTTKLVRKHSLPIDQSEIEERPLHCIPQVVGNCDFESAPRAVNCPGNNSRATTVAEVEAEGRSLQGVTARVCDFTEPLQSGESVTATVAPFATVEVNPLQPNSDNGVSGPTA